MKKLFYIKPSLQRLIVFLFISLITVSMPLSGVAKAASPAQRLGHGILTSIAASPDGSTLAVGASIGVYFFDPTTFEQKGFWDLGKWVSSVAYNSDGSALLVDQQVFDIASGRPNNIAPENFQWVNDNCSPDGVRCAYNRFQPKSGGCGINDELCIYWDHFIVKNSDTLVDEALIILYYPKDFAWSPDGTRLFTVSGGKSPTFTERSNYLAYTIRAYDTHTWVKTNQLNGFFADTMYGTEWSSDGKRIATFGARPGSYVLKALAWDLASQLYTETARCSYRTAQILSCDPPFIDFQWHKLFIRNAQTGILEPRFAPHRIYLWAASTNADQSLIVTSGENEMAGDSLSESAPANRTGTTRIWDVDTLQMLAEIPSIFYKVEFAPDASLIVGQSATAIEVWNWRTGQLLWSQANPIENQCYHFYPWCWLGTDTFGFDINDKYIAAYSFASANPNVAALWNFNTGELVSSLEGHTDRVTGIAFNPAGTQIATASEDGTILIWDTP